MSKNAIQKNLKSINVYKNNSIIANSFICFSHGEKSLSK